ncbi:DUF998 domain-containing protein [Propionimicrobium lymphophilum]|uniref:DUF998 domain-containing protein n=1 Tax=Propionimicrobium lymphophilum TaxID=33012 RepID=UPI000407C418|nr:DUF998 domain-containing protein [Propionimicrobium lymphophilum]
MSQDQNSNQDFNPAENQEAQPEQLGVARSEAPEKAANPVPTEGPFGGQEADASCSASNQAPMQEGPQGFPNYGQFQRPGQPVPPQGQFQGQPPRPFPGQQFPPQQFPGQPHPQQFQGRPFPGQPPFQGQPPRPFPGQPQGNQFPPQPGQPFPPQQAFQGQQQGQQFNQQPVQQRADRPQGIQPQAQPQAFQPQQGRPQQFVPNNQQFAQQPPQNFGQPQSNQQNQSSAFDDLSRTASQAGQEISKLMAKESRRWPILGGISGIVLLLSTLFPWSSASIFDSSIGFNAFNHGFAGIGAFLVSLIAIAAFVVKLVVPEFKYRKQLAWVALSSGVLAVVFTIIVMVSVFTNDYIGLSLSFGIFLALVASLAIIAFSILDQFGSKGVANIVDNIQETAHNLTNNNQQIGSQQFQPNYQNQPAQQFFVPPAQQNAAPEQDAKQQTEAPAQTDDENENKE